MIEEILFILHVVNGIHMIIHNVIWCKYMYSNNIIVILVRISLIFGVIIQIIFCQFLENGNRYNVEFSNVHYYFNELSNDISHFVVA